MLCSGLSDLIRQSASPIQPGRTIRAGMRTISFTLTFSPSSSAMAVSSELCSVGIQT